jgi:hypothetical protein
MYRGLTMRGGEGGNIGIDVDGKFDNMPKILDEVQEAMNGVKETELGLRSLGKSS